MKYQSIALSLLFALGACATGDEPELASLQSEVVSATNPIDHGALPWSAAQTATLSSTAGFHAWQVTLTGSASVTFSTARAAGGPASVNTVIVLYRQQADGTWGSAIAQNNDGPTPPWSRLVSSLTAGTYRVMVKGSTTSVTGAFALTAACSGAGCAATCPEPVLSSEDASVLDPAVATFNAGARSGFTWCRIAPLSQYSTAVCPAAPPSLATIVEQVIAVEDELRGWSFADGQVLTAAQVAAIEPFTTTCSPGGPGFASAVSANISGATPQGWVIGSEVPCHNCHEFGNFYVIWYPADGQVLLVPYITGYDS